MSGCADCACTDCHPSNEIDGVFSPHENVFLFQFAENGLQLKRQHWVASKATARIDLLEQLVYSALIPALPFTKKLRKLL
jgi:hypothetical protein